MKNRILVKWNEAHYRDVRSYVVPESIIDMKREMIGFADADHWDGGVDLVSVRWNTGDELGCLRRHLVRVSVEEEKTAVLTIKGGIVHSSVMPDGLRIIIVDHDVVTESLVYQFIQPENNMSEATAQALEENEIEF